MFTFKTKKPTGRWRSFERSTHIIKIKGSKVGEINDEHPHKISLIVLKDDILEDGNSNCEWKWITLKKESNSVSEAKEFLINMCQLLKEKYKLYHLK